MYITTTTTTTITIIIIIPFLLCKHDKISLRVDFLIGVDALCNVTRLSLIYVYIYIYTMFTFCSFHLSSVLPLPNVA